MMANKHKKHGLPPGSLVYVGAPSNTRVKITLIEYNDEDYFEQEFYDLSECLAKLKPNHVKWINVDGVHQIELVEAIGKHFNIHPLTQEDIVHVEQRPKFEEYDNYVLAIMKMIDYQEAISAEQLSLLLLDSTVISFQQKSGDAFDIIRNRLRQGKGRIRKLGADYLYYALMDAVVDFYFHVLEKIGDEVEVIEEQVIDKNQKDALKNLYELKRELIFLRKQIWPLRDLISNMKRSEVSLITDNTQLFLRDLQDHAIRIIDSVETYRDLLSGIMDVHLSNMSNKTNEVMKFLTVISSIFIPVTFVAGIYGMNFEFMPELKTTNGYFITWLVMIGMMVGQVIYFRKKKWL
jgi:magnesium transporter